MRRTTSYVGNYRDCARQFFSDGTAHLTMDDMAYLLALEEKTYLLLAAALILEEPEPDEQLP